MARHSRQCRRLTEGHAPREAWLGRSPSSTNISPRSIIGRIVGHANSITQRKRELDVLPRERRWDLIVEPERHAATMG